MILELKNIEKTFDEKKVLSGVSFKVEGGKAFGLLGRNGAGKTTLLRILMNIFPQTNGEILLDNHPINYSKIKIGYLPEERGLYPKRIIIDQLVYFSELKGMSHEDALKIADYWLEKLNMSHCRNKCLDTLSKGNQQKIQLITALAHNPDIVILDEPFSGLDPVNAKLLKDVIKEQITEGKIVLFSSHQMSYIEEFCDSIAILNAGRIVLQGNLHDIKRAHTHDRLVVRTEYPEKIKADFNSVCTITDREKLIFQLSPDDDKKTLMKNLIDNYPIDEIKIYEPSLNNIFVEYTEDH